MDRRRYNVIIFDLDGTLIDSFSALAAAVNHARSVAGLDELAPDVIRGYVGHGVEPLLEQSFGGIPTDEITRVFNARYDEICCQESRLLHEVDATLERLADLGYTMAVCTNKPTSFSAKILHHLGVGRHFAVIAGPDLAGARKPDPEHVHWVLEQLGCKPLDALFVGDMLVDLEAARGAGVDVALLTAESAGDRAALRSAGPDYLFEQIHELLPILEQVEAAR